MESDRRQQRQAERMMAANLSQKSFFILLSCVHCLQICLGRGEPKVWPLKESFKCYAQRGMKVLELLSDRLPNRTAHM
ncbi:hypothetical protein DPX16_5634 [Anabarilius grahami]|uniref:Uncharacterized protein n=1 Tax=Anabarilius grahami TaxID=495550 RepID=A0A3N0YQH7_ANAGA|nr:hypothetical protein DPX16_5634 [Anabarilius grahami]